MDVQTAIPRRSKFDDEEDDSDVGTAYLTIVYGHVEIF